MPRIAKEFSPIEVSRLTDPGMHFVGVVPGLALKVSAGGSRSWILRATIGTKRRDIGLGPYPAVTLADARKAARAKRVQIESGVDPVADARERQNALRAAQAAELTFAQAAQKFIAAKSSEWDNHKHARQWTATLEVYAFPQIGRVAVRDVELPHVLAVLEPIWTEKTETASRLRGRIEQVLDWAAARGYRDGPNPARWRGHLDKLLARPTKVKRVQHHRALPFADMPSFMERLRTQTGIGARALEFLILTAARSGEVRGANWSEIDLEHGIWVVPAERMKARREHRVPLSEAAVSLLEAQPRLAGTNLVFPSARLRPLSDMTLSAIMKRMKVDAVPHGFRSTFRDWVGEQTNFPHEVAEMALAHTIPNKAEAAYRRGDLFEKRRKLMQAWAQACTRPVCGADVVGIRHERAA